MQHLSGTVLLAFYWFAIVAVMLVSYGLALFVIDVRSALQRRRNRITSTYNKVSPYQVRRGIQE